MVEDLLGYVVDLVEPLALLSLALFALSLWRFARNDRFLPFAAAAVSAIAASRLNQPLFYWTDVESLQTVIVARYVVFNPLAIVLWIIACNRFAGWSDRRFDLAACLFGILAGIAALPHVDAQLLQSVARAALLVQFCWSIFHVAPRRSPAAAGAADHARDGGRVIPPRSFRRSAFPGSGFRMASAYRVPKYALATVIPLLRRAAASTGFLRRGRAGRRSLKSPGDSVSGSGLPDILTKDLAVIFCGINPGATAAAAGRHFVSSTNRFWRVLHLAEFTPVQIDPANDPNDSALWVRADDGGSRGRRDRLLICRDKNSNKRKRICAQKSRAIRRALSRFLESPPSRQS